ncbi:hypothetical protein VYU27_008011 [Nannochloropsis oceanica]
MNATHALSSSSFPLLPPPQWIMNQETGKRNQKPCLHCSRDKVKCDGNFPCDRCFERSYRCSKNTSLPLPRSHLPDYPLASTRSRYRRRSLASGESESQAVAPEEGEKGREEGEANEVETPFADLVFSRNDPLSQVPYALTAFHRLHAEGRISRERVVTRLRMWQAWSLAVGRDVTYSLSSAIAKALSITPIELESPSTLLTSPPCSALRAETIGKFHRIAVASQALRGTPFFISANDESRACIFSISDPESDYIVQTANDICQKWLIDPQSDLEAQILGRHAIQLLVHPALVCREDRVTYAESMLILGMTEMTPSKQSFLLKGCPRDGEAKLFLITNHQVLLPVPVPSSAGKGGGLSEEGKARGAMGGARYVYAALQYIDICPPSRHITDQPGKRYMKCARNFRRDNNLSRWPLPSPSSLPPSSPFSLSTSLPPPLPFPAHLSSLSPTISSISSSSATTDCCYSGPCSLFVPPAREKRAKMTRSEGEGGDGEGRGEGGKRGNDTAAAAAAAAAQGVRETTKTAGGAAAACLEVDMQVSTGIGAILDFVDNNGSAAVVQAAAAVAASTTTASVGGGITAPRGHTDTDSCLHNPRQNSGENVLKEDCKDDNHQHHHHQQRQQQQQQRWVPAEGTVVPGFATLPLPLSLSRPPTSRSSSKNEVDSKGDRTGMEEEKVACTHEDLHNKRKGRNRGKQEGREGVGIKMKAEGEDGKDEDHEDEEEGAQNLLLSIFPRASLPSSRRDLSHKSGSSSSSSSSFSSSFSSSDLAALAATNKAFESFRFQHWQTQDKTIAEGEWRAWWVCLASQRLSPYLTTKELCLSLAVTAKPFRPFGRQPWRLRPRSWSPLLLQRMAKGKLQEVTWFELPGTFQGHTDSRKHIAFLHSLVPAFTRLPLLTHLHVCGLRVSLLAKILDEALPLALLPSFPPSSSQKLKKAKGGGGKARLLVLDAGTHASRQATVYPTTLFHNLTSLHTLRLSGRYQVLPCLAQAIKGRHLPRLESLDVSWAWLEAKDLRPLHRAVEEVMEGGTPFPLRRLDMSNNTLDDTAVELLTSIFEKTEQTIEEVRLEGNRFTREGKKALGRSAAAIVNDSVGKGMTLLL